MDKQTSQMQREALQATAAPQIASAKPVKKGPLILAVGVLSVLAVVWAATPQRAAGNLSAAGADTLTQDEIKKRAAEFAAAPPLTFATVDPRQFGEVAEFLTSGVVQNRDKAIAGALQQFQSGNVRVAWLTLWDNCAEDGDMVMVNSGGYSINVRLTKAPQSIAVPLAASGATDLQVIGMGDGGGGITVGAAGNGVAISLPVMQPGQVVLVHAQ